MRNATVYGVSPRLRLDIVLNNLAGWAHTTGRIRLLSDGTSWRPLIHVRDLSRARSRMLEAPAELVRGEAFNIGSDEQNYLVRDLAGVLADVTGCEIELAGDASPGPALVPRRLLQARRRLPGAPVRLGLPTRRRGARRRLPLRAADRGAVRGAARTSGCASSGI